MSAITHYVGNLSPALFYQIRRPIAGATNPDDPAQQENFPIPANTTVAFYLRELGTDVLRVDGAAATIVNPLADDPADTDAGRVRYDWAAADVAEPAGEFVGWFRLTYPGDITQDTPEFLWLLAEHYEGPEGLYTSVASLKDFTGLDALKTASDEWLATNVIPRAEAWLAAFGPFVSATCPQLGLAANVLAEGIFLRVDPSVRNRAGLEGLKSETIGDYSYTMSDAGAAAASTSSSSAWDDLLQEVDNILAACRLEDGTSGAVLYASEGDVFARLPTDTYDRTTGDLLTAFSVETEVQIIRSALEVWR